MTMTDPVPHERIDLFDGDFVIQKGELFLLTSGNYSDYGVDSLYRALRDLKMEEFKQQPDAALWLLKTGAAEEVFYKELWLDI
jgi:hypothetical protein